VPDYVIRFLGPLMIVAAMAASHPASQDALDAFGDQVVIAWNQLARTGDCTTPGGASCMTPFALPSNAETTTEGSVTF